MFPCIVYLAYAVAASPVLPIRSLPLSAEPDVAVPLQLHAPSTPQFVPRELPVGQAGLARELPFGQPGQTSQRPLGQLQHPVPRSSAFDSRGAPPMSAVHGPDSFPSASFPQRAPEYGSSGRIPDMPSERIGDAVRLWPHAPTNPPSNGRIGDAVRLWPDAPGSSQLQANGRSSNPALPSASRQNGLRGQHATDEEYYAAVNRADAVWLDGPPSTQLRAAQLPAQVPAAIKSPLAPRKIGAFWDGQPNLVAQERNDIMKQFNDPQLYSLRRHRRIRSEIRGRDGNPPPNPILQLSPPNPVPEPPAV